MHFRILVLDRIFVVLPAEIPAFMLPKGLEEGFYADPSKYC